MDAFGMPFEYSCKIYYYNYLKNKVKLDSNHDCREEKQKA